MKVDYYDLPTSIEAVGLLLREFAGQRVAIVSGLDPGEPVFALRGHDIHTVDTIQFWFDRAADHSLSAEDRFAGVERDIAEIEAWQEANPGKVRAPD